METTDSIHSGDMVDGPIKGFGGLTDDTYMDWILERAKRFFLVSSPALDPRLLLTYTATR